MRTALKGFRCFRRDLRLFCAVTICLSAKLLSYAKLFDNSAVTLNVLLLKINKELTTVAYHFKKSTTAVMVLVVLFKMLIEVLDSRSKYSDLNLGGAGVLLVNLVSLDNLLLFFLH